MYVLSMYIPLVLRNLQIGMHSVDLQFAQCNLHVHLRGGYIYMYPPLKCTSTCSHPYIHVHVYRYCTCTPTCNHPYIHVYMYMYTYM